jgi:predicted GNAT family acetyltransferase
MTATTGPRPDGDSPARALERANALLARILPGGDAGTDASGIGRIVIPVPVPWLSGLFVAQQSVDRDRLRAMADEFVQRGKPWSIRVVGPVPDAVTEVAGELGLVPEAVATLVAPLDGPLRTPLEHPDEEHRRVETVEDVRAWAAICDAALGLPEGTSATMTTADLIAEPSARTYLALRDGVAVATAISMLDARGWLGVFSVTTLPEARRRGISERLVRTVLAEGAAAGAHTAYLQSTDMARPMYERIGFRDAGDDTVVYARPPAEPDAA